MRAADPLGVGEELSVDGGRLRIFALDRLAGIDAPALERRPLTVKIVLENLLRHAERTGLTAEAARGFALGRAEDSRAERPFFPSRVLLQDFTGVPVLTDLSAIGSAASLRGIDISRASPRVPVDLVVDHSVQVDSYGSARSLLINLDREYARNAERYDFLRWARESYANVRVVPPGNGIVHQVNLEYLAKVIDERTVDGFPVAFPDTLVGTDSHTTMVNGLGVLGFGVGGIEAEAVMLGEPYFLAPVRVVGVRLTGRLPEGATATDLVLTITQRLRRKGVVDRFVEFYGPGLASLSVPDRATISNMCPEYGATAALFPIDRATIRYLTGTGRPDALVHRVEAYARRQGLWHEPGGPEPEYADRLDIDLDGIVPTVSGPRNPEEAAPLSQVPARFAEALSAYRAAHPVPASVRPSDGPVDGSVVIAAITSCTNTSIPSVMLGAGLIARRARERGMKVPAHVKTSLAPGSKVVTSYLERTGLLGPLAELGFDVVGYGCTTCIGNSGPLPDAVASRVRDDDLFVAAVLSGNRNFEARIHNQVRANFLASPMLVVAYALAGRVDIDLSRDPLGADEHGRPVRLSDLWPKAEEVRELLETAFDPELFRERYRRIDVGDRHWEELPTHQSAQYPFDPESTYLRLPPFLEAPPAPPALSGTLFADARVLAALDDRVSTDHISPAGEIAPQSPAGQWLQAHGVTPPEFNTYGSRRGNHEVMVRGTFANVRLRNALAGGREGGYTAHLPDGELTTIFAASERYRADAVPLVVLAGSSYGQGSSRDWAAKGPALLGVRAVLAKSFERIHRGNLIGMGILPLEFVAGAGWRELGLTGRERFTLATVDGAPLGPGGRVQAVAHDDDAPERRFELVARIDAPIELEYYRAGGLLPYILGRLAPGKPSTHSPGLDRVSGPPGG